MTLGPEQRRFLLVHQSIVAFAINVLLNGAIGWAMFRGARSVPFWGEASVGGDTLGTSFFLPAITCLIVTPLVRRQVARGEVPALEGGLAGWLRPFQRRLVPRALGLGLVSALVAGSAAVGVLAALGVDALAFAPFLGWKALYAGVLAAGIQPAIALLALADPPRA